MAKTRAKTALIQKTRLARDSRIGLKRLSHGTSKRFDITAKIHEKVLTMNEVAIKSTDGFTFNIDLKIDAKRISVQPKKPAVSLVHDRILRPRPAVEFKSSSKKDRKPNLIVATSQSKCTSKIVDEAWDKCKSYCNQIGASVHPEDVVLAKLKGHKPWPATALGFVSNTKVLVKFFGAKQSETLGYVSITEITPFKHSMDPIRAVLLTMKRDIALYKKGVREAELTQGVPSHLSILNDI